MKNWAKVEDGVVVNIAVGYENPGGYVEYSLSGEFRKNAAMIGGTYDKEKDIFINPKPWESWVLDENDNWVSPAGEKPVKEGFFYSWDEESLSWKEYEIVEIDL
jgi:hypothetical protein